ncbi:hypothetical protein L1049_022978 [Liquidambar formosana]|uniref:DUF4283 domain-containing protein n=1 Tax=Liquidambar formosana TaxID=63359 RepID=A0AAP0WSJ0_LIQFO
MATNTFLFVFSKADDRTRVLLTSPWSVFGFHLVLKEWPPSLTIEEIDFSFFAFWVQIHGLPLDRKIQSNASKIGAFLGKFVTVDPSTCGSSSCEKFLRIKVELCILNPLKNGFFLKREESRIDV